MLVSIIVPVYNVEAYLCRCVESLIYQTYKNIEIILVDDGSTDNSGKLCDKFEMMYPEKIKVIHKRNGGLSDARNVGIKNIHGSYICFVDSDDFVSEKMVEVMVSDIQKYDVEIACVGYQNFDHEENLADIENISNVTEVYDRFAAVKLLFSSEGYCNFAWNKLYKAELFNAIEFPYGRKMEDLGTTYLLIDKCNRISYNRQKLYYYFQREDSILHNTDRNFYIDKCLLAMERYQYLKNKYGDFEENIEFIIFSIFQCYPYIINKKNLCEKAENEMEYLWKNKRNSFTLKRKIKFWLFKYNKKMYCKIWGKGMP